MGWATRLLHNTPCTSRTSEPIRPTMIPTRFKVWMEGCRTRDLIMCRILSSSLIPLFLHPTALWWWMMNECSLVFYLPAFIGRVDVLYFSVQTLNKIAKHLWCLFFFKYFFNNIIKSCCFVICGIFSFVSNKNKNDSYFFNFRYTVTVCNTKWGYWHNLKLVALAVYEYGVE